MEGAKEHLKNGGSVGGLKNKTRGQKKKSEWKLNVKRLNRLCDFWVSQNIDSYSYIFTEIEKTTLH